MNAADVIALTLDGAVYCLDCLDDDENNPEIGAWFADNEDSLIGSTCDACGKCYTPDGWMHVSKGDYRWSRCIECDAQRPYDKDDSEIRLEARKGQLRCIDCGGEEHF